MSVSMRGFFFGVKWPDMKLATLFHPLPNLGMRRSLLPRPTYLNGMHRDIIICTWKCWWKFADLRWLNVSTNIASVVCTYRYELKIHKMFGPCRNCNREPPVVFLNFEVKMHSNLYTTRCNVTRFILSGNCSTCFGWYLHPSSGAQTTVSTASGICQTLTATCCYSGR